MVLPNGRKGAWLSSALTANRAARSPTITIIRLWIVQVAGDIDELKYSRSVTIAVNYSPVRLDENG